MSNEKKAKKPDATENRKKQPPSEASILEAIESSGFALEAEIGRVLSLKNWAVAYSEQYVDFEENKNREIDVVALSKKTSSAAPDISVTARLVIECKKSVTGFVFIGQSRSATTGIFPPGPLCIGSPSSAPFSSIPGPYGDSNPGGSRPCFEFLGLDEYYPPFKTGLLAHQILRIDGTNPEKPRLDSAINDYAVPLAKAMAAIGEKPAWNKSGKTLPLNWTVNIPVLVVRGPIRFYDTNQSPHELQKPGSLTLRVEVGDDEKKYICPVQVVTEEAFPEFLAQVEKMLSAATQQAEANAKNFQRFTEAKKSSRFVARRQNSDYWAGGQKLEW